MRELLTHRAETLLALLLDVFALAFRVRVGHARPTRVLRKRGPEGSGTARGYKAVRVGRTSQVRPGRTSWYGWAVQDLVRVGRTELVRAVPDLDWRLILVRGRTNWYGAVQTGTNT